MVTKISMVDEADAWCKRLGNFAPASYHCASAPSEWMHTSHSVEAVARATVRLPRTSPGSFLVSALCVVALGWPLTAAAQMGGGMGGHGGHGNRGSRPSTATSNSSIATTVDVPNPLRTMLGEMRKLRVDLLLTSAQIEPWSKMEDALRECVDLEHSRRPTLRAGVQVDAEGYIQAIADNERALADAENRFAGATKIALATLNPRQLQTTRDRFASAISDAQSPTLATP